MQRFPQIRLALAASLVALAVSISSIAPVAHAEFPPITDAHKKLTAVPGHPGAPAVVLFHEGDMLFRDPNVQRLVTIFNVRKRIKILNQQGVEDYGTLVLPHSRYERISNFQGRTVLPDGSELPVGDDAIFERAVSQAERFYETAVAFPSVVPGAILDYSYEIRNDSMFYTEPWYFQSTIPTLHSEITYHPSDYQELGNWGMTLPGRAFQSDSSQEKNGRSVKIWLDDLPPIPDEPWSVPVTDLSARVMMYVETYDEYHYLESWRTLVDIVDDGTYKPMLKNDGRAKAKARELTEGLKDDRQKAQALYRFVRDEIGTIPVRGVLGGDQDKGVDAVMADGRGMPSEKALLLHSLLSNAKIDSELVWVPDANEGMIDPNVANPFWFDRMLVRLEMGGETVYLDPSDDSLAFGTLRPFNEGQPAVLVRKKPEVIETPSSSWDAHGRKAELDLAVGEDGRITGTGVVTHQGHNAWAVLHPGQGNDTVLDAWTESLEDDFPGYAVSDVTVDQRVDDGRLEVRFALAQKDEEVLGDEVTLAPTRPFGPLGQRFELPPSRRLTPVRLPFGSWQEVVTEVTWPEGWTVEQTPAQIDDRNPVGAVELRVETREEERKLTVRRRFEIHKREFPDGLHYDNLRQLYATVSEHDAQPLVLVKGAG